MIYSILCVDKKFGIGKKNDLLFHLPKDMSYFREKTRGHVVAMGENTLLSFPGQKPLPKRTNIVLSKDVDHNYEGCVNVHDFNEFLRLLKKHGEKEDVFVIGGASIYHQTLLYVDGVYLTKVDADGGAEVFFDNIDKIESFECLSESEPLEDNGYKIRFCYYQNHSKKDIE